MLKAFLSFLILASWPFGKVNAQEHLVKVFTSKFISQSSTYNASPDPTECWEAVEWGIKIKDGKHDAFFNLNYLELEKLKAKIGEEEVQIEVVYYQEGSEGGAAGEVTKVTLKGEVLYEKK